MLFNSYIFILAFMPVMIIGYFFLNSKGAYKAALGFLTLMSFVFTAWLNVFYLVVLIPAILINYLLGRKISEAVHRGTGPSEESQSGGIQGNGIQGSGIHGSGQQGSQSGKLLLILGLVLNIGALFAFKYVNFFSDTINVIFKTNIPLLKIILPLGISFYTFSQISYLVDCYRNQCDKYTLLEYAAYVSYFPKFIQGPITFSDAIISQFRDDSKKKVQYENLSVGLYMFALGLGKKVLLADVLSLIVDAGYNNAERICGLGAIIAVIAYSLQIYFDFSGYCDIAAGVSKMLNIELPMNFNSPYKAVSVSDFWSRWHMTLTGFFTKYLYIPMGGNRKGNLRTCLNVMIVFLVSGLWHGANITFVLWGALHGIFMVFERLTNIKTHSNPKGIIKALRKTVTFIIVTVLWSLFRADSIGQFATLWSRVFRGSFFEEGVNPDMVNSLNEVIEIQILNKVTPGFLAGKFPGMFVIAMLILGLVICFVPKNVNEKAEKFSPTGMRMLLTVGLMIWCILSMGTITTFIYSNF